MRSILPLSLPDLSPLPLDGRAEPMFDRLSPGDLLVDETYQRDLSPRSLKLIRQIVEQWDWLKFKPPVVALTDRGFEVVDGQHTAIAAACHPDIDTVPVIVIDGSSLSGRAEAFVSHARDRVAVTPGQVFQAEITAGDEAAVAIDQLCGRAGVRILPFSPPFGTRYGVGDTTALAAIKALVKRRGPAKAEEILDALSSAGLAPIMADHIKAADALCCEPEYAAEFDAERLTVTLKALGTGIASEVKALAATKGLPMWRALAATLFKHRKTKPRLAERQVAASAAPASAFGRPSAAHPSRTVIPIGEPAPGRSALDQQLASLGL